MPSGWRNVPTSPQHSVLTGPAGQHQIGYRFTRDGVRIDGLPAAVLISLTPDLVLLEVDGLIRRWHVARYPGDDRLFVDGDTGSVTFTAAPRYPEPAQAADEGSLRAPLPGTVTELYVAVGDEVGADQELLVIEAMKMRHVIRAGRPGLVEALPVRAGSTVEVDAILAVLTEVPA
jgi:propionyl-CoA carboxylase alpha chain